MVGCGAPTLLNAAEAGTFELEHPGCGGVFRHHNSYYFIEASIQLLSPERL
jgi:hypothetical protein